MMQNGDVKQLVHDYYQTINDDRVGQLGDFVSSRYQHHVPGLKPSVQAFQQVLNMYRHGFPDIHYAIDDVIIGAEKIVCQLTVTGTHSGYFLGHPPTGKSFRAQGIDVFRLRDGKIAERWGHFDTMTMLQQLGLYKPMGM